MSLVSKNGSLLAKSGHLCNTCCKTSHYRCDPDLRICVRTEDAIGDNVFGSLADCMTGCQFTPCETAGCAFNIQFYYLKEWNTHFCDSAVYDAYCGDRLLGVVNLNNGSEPDTGGSRYSAWYGITIDDFNSDSCAYTMTLKCKLPGGCHSGLAGIKLSSGHDFPNMVNDAWALSANEVCNSAP